MTDEIGQFSCLSICNNYRMVGVLFALKYLQYIGLCTFVLCRSELGIFAIALPEVSNLSHMRHRITSKLLFSFYHHFD